MDKLNLALKEIGEDTLDINPRSVNVNIDGDVISLSSLEKIFFLTKLNSDPAFIASVLSIDVKKIDRIIHNCNFQEIIDEYLSEYFKHQAGENVEQLILRYSDLLKECFTSVRISIGMKIREAMENGKPLETKFLGINAIERLMRLEFALHGLPVDIKGFLHASKDNKNAKDKSDDELIKSLNEVTEAISKATEKGFDPAKYLESNSIDAEIVDDKVDEEVLINDVVEEDEIEDVEKF